MVKGQVVEIYDEKLKKTISYYMDVKLKTAIDKKIKPSLLEEDRDHVLVVDGMEGTGKSTLALQLAKYIDHSFNLNRVVFDADEFRNKVFSAKKGQCIVYDEAITGFSSVSALSPVNRVLKSLMMQMRQKNLCVIIVIPTFFLLDKYVALFRARNLIHVYENKGRRGYFRIYNRKKKKYLYLMGKQTLSYSGKNWKVNVFTKFKGRFYGVFALGDSSIEEKYKEKKLKALSDTEKSPMSSAQIRYRDQRDIILYLLRKISDLTYEKLSNLLGDYDIEMSYVQISRICAKFGDKEKEKDKKDIKEPKEPLLDKELPENEDFDDKTLNI